MVKVLHVSISSSYGGGPEHIYQLIAGLSGEFENHVASPDDGPYFEKFKDLTDGKVTTIPFRRFEVKYLKSILKYIKVNKIDLIHAHGKGAGFYCRIISMVIKIPVIYTPHGINQKVEVGLKNKLYLLFERTFKSLINSIIYVSQTESEYAAKLNIWPNVPTQIIHNGTKKFVPSEVEIMRMGKIKEMDWLSKKIVVTASRYDFQKNTLEFCKIAAKLPEFLFVILGDGVDMDVCKAFCNDNCINNVYFAGAVADPVNYFAASDVYLSTARWEGLSMAILESMAVGLPIVATNVIGNIDLITNSENGYLYNIGEVDKAAECITNILRVENYQTFSDNATRIHDQMFSSQSMCQNTAALYTRVLEKA